MKYDVRIEFYSHGATEITTADKVELLAVGDGVLSVIKVDTNRCYNLTDIMMYTIRNKEDSECKK
jgi:hypothetical protein